MYAEVKNFKSEIGCVIVFKMLIYRKIRGYLEMTNENVRFFSHFILGTYLVDIKLITSHFLPIFTLINIRTRVPFKITSTPNNQYITKLPNLQKRVFPQKNKKTSPTRQYTYPQYTYNSYFSYRERRSFSMHNARKLHS